MEKENNTVSILCSKIVGLPTIGISKEVTKFIEDKKIQPIFIYDYLSESSVKTRVLNETSDLAGIYLILNKKTSHYYIGSASTGKFHSKLINHLFEFKGSKVLKNAVKEYKLSSFAFIVIRLFTETVNKENNKKLIDLEDFYIKHYLPDYNILTEAGTNFGYKHSQKTRINMMDNYSKKSLTAVAIDAENSREGLSRSVIEKAEKAVLSRTKDVYDLFTSEKGKAIKNKKIKNLVIYNKNGTVYGSFNSVAEAAIRLGSREKSIVRALKTAKNQLNRR